MKIITASNGKSIIKMTRKDWVKIGQQADFFQHQNPEDPNFMADESGRKFAIPGKIKNKVNKDLHALGNFHVQIPLEQIFKIINDVGIIPLQEDNTPWSGMLIGGAECGSEETKNQVVNFSLAINIGDKFVVSNNSLSLSWCKMPSGKYEIVTYLS